MEMRREVAKNMRGIVKCFIEDIKFDIKFCLIYEELLRKTILAEDSMYKCQEAGKNIQCMGYCK